MSYPRISIVTACYNHNEYIAETIESVLSQKYPNLQYVVLDDGSTDGSWEVIKKYKKDLFHCERMEGYRESPTIALNYGFSLTDGDIMGWINSDDVLLKNCFFTVANIFQDNPSVEWLTGMATKINFKSQMISSKLILKNKYDFLNEDWDVIQQESTFWRRSLWEKAGSGLITGKEFGAFDTELWTRFFPLTHHYHIIAPLGAYRKSKASKAASNADSFRIPNTKYLSSMRQKASANDKRHAMLYKRLKIISPLLAYFSDDVYKKIPVLHKFAYKIIMYKSETDHWVIRDVNPYKRVYY